MLKTHFRFIRERLRALVIWPLTCGVLVCALWAWTEARIREEMDRIRADALLAASFQAKAYAEQLDRALSHIDYITLSLKHQWQQTGGALTLEDHIEKGLVPSSSVLAVTIVDRDGFPVTSTLPHNRRISIADRDYFLAHKADRTKGMVITQPVVGIRSKRPVMLLSRRLDARDGSFAGMVVVAVCPSYLGPAREEAAMGADDFIEGRRTDGAFFAAKIHGSGQTGGTMFQSTPAFAGDKGRQQMPNDRFVDDKARFVAWDTAKSYPLMSIVGLSEQGRLAQHQKRERELRLHAAAGTLVLVLLAAGGVCFARRKRYSRQVSAAYRLATESAREGFYMLRPVYGDNQAIVDFVIEDGNEHGARYYGMTRKQMIGVNVSRLSPLGFQEHILPVCRRAMEQGFYEDEMQVPRNSNHRAQWVQRRIVRSGIGLAATVRDISELKAHEQQLQRLANADTVTSLPNRHWLMNYLPAALEKARITDTALAVLFVDLDDFKNINDTLGHAAGDEVLQAVAARLKLAVRPQDSVVRLGGDEFTIILESVSNDSQVAGVAQRILATLDEPFAIGDLHRHIVKASIGVSMFPKDGCNVETLLKHADIAMYAAKADGKSGYRFFQPHLSDDLVARLNMQHELKQAIERGSELVLYYQPRVKTGSGELIGMEALVRWIHPVRGLIAPDEFIPIAEATGLIVPLGEHVIAEACAQQAQWKQHNLRVVPISVNVSGRQLNDGSVAAVLAASMKRYGIDPGIIEIEITESSTVGEGKTAASELAFIKALGIKLYVDDFGTGYSSLSQLKRLDVDGLKVDRTFTSQLNHGPEDKAFFRAIVSMAHAIGLRVVAEGVENVEQLRVLQELSCDEVQGYYIGRPVPASAVPALLEKRFLFPD